MINTKYINNTHVKQYLFATSIFINCYKSKLFYKTYSSFSDTKKDKIVGKIKHYPAFNKEWKDGVYTYNKTYLKNVSFKYKLTNDLIKSYFSLNDKNSIARSKRMRGLIRRSSSKRIFIGKPEIKQTNDKTVITLYIFDRDKQSVIRNLYFYNRKSYLYNLWLTNKYKKQSKNSVIFSKNRKILIKKTSFPYKNIGLRNESDFLKFRLFNLYKKFSRLNKCFSFLFLSHILSMFKVKILIPFKNNKELNNKLIENALNNKPNVIILVINNKLEFYNIANNKFNSNTLNLFITKNNDIRNLDLNKINNYLWFYIEKIYINNKIIDNSKINFLYKTFKNNNYNRFITKYFKKKSKILQYFIKLELNKLKFKDFLINLKSLIAKVYKKNIELNIINLKYVYLNSDIYAQFIGNKLKKRMNAITTLQKSLSMVKIPYSYYLKNKEDNLHNLNDLNTFKSLSLSNINSRFVEKDFTKLPYDDKLNLIIKKLFPSNVINNIKSDYIQDSNDNLTFIKGNKITSVLNTVKNKWIKGIKLEIAGRLTKRNTAARSLSKFRYKGNLNNKQYYLESNYLYNMSTVMLRNSVRSNTQYTFLNSKKRIGAFGIKSWISNF